MIPGKRIEDSVRALVAGDTALLAKPADAPLVTLVNAPFVPGRNTTYGSIAPATFTGSAPLSGIAGAQIDYLDPSNGDETVQLAPPVGGWLFKCTAAPAATETIYGYVVTNQATTIYYGGKLLPTPIPINSIGDAVDLGDIRMGLPIGSWQDDPMQE